MSLTAGKTYTVTFWAKASKTRPLSIAVQKGVSPYTSYLNGSVSLSTSWKQYSLQFIQPQIEYNGQLAFNFAQATGYVWIDNVSLK
jgi:hypothetical protein